MRPSEFRSFIVAVVALLHGQSSSFADEAAWKASHDAGWKAYQEGRIGEAETSLRAAAKEVRAFSPNDPRVATTLDHLSWVFCAQGKYADAEPLAKWALDSREKRLGAHHHEVAESLNTLACLYDAQGKYEKAELRFHVDSPCGAPALRCVCFVGWARPTGLCPGR